MHEKYGFETDERDADLGGKLHFKTGSEQS
jgi:hypothetical protein